MRAMVSGALPAAVPTKRSASVPVRPATDGLRQAMLDAAKPHLMRIIAALRAAVHTATDVPLSAYGFSKLTGEVYCRAAHDEHGFPPLVFLADETAPARFCQRAALLGQHGPHG